MRRRLAHARLDRVRARLARLDASDDHGPDTLREAMPRDVQTAYDALTVPHLDTLLDRVPLPPTLDPAPLLTVSAWLLATGRGRIREAWEGE